MKIALGCDSRGGIAATFAEITEFRLYEITSGRVTERTTLHPAACGAAGRGRFLFECGVDLLICGRVARAEYAALDGQGLRVVGGVSGTDDPVLNAYLAGELELRRDFLYD